MANGGSGVETSNTQPSDKQPSDKQTWRAKLAAVRRDRTALAMLLLGFGAGLPFAVLTGTVNAWFTQTGVEISTIGVLSWTGLALAFKFLWSPALHKTRAPGVLQGRMGQRRGWILLFQTIILIAMIALSLSDPATMLPLIAVAILVGVIAEASGDIVIDAWRIEIAKDASHLDLLSTLYQLGFRVAAYFGGAIALVISARTDWNIAFFVMSLFMFLPILGTFLAQEPPRDAVEAKSPIMDLGGSLPRGMRNLSVLAVMALWGWAILTLLTFMGETLLAEDAPNATLFTRNWGPVIVVATVIAPAVISALLLRQASRTAPNASAGAAWRGQKALDTLYGSILEPLMDIIKRLGWAAPLVLILILSYRFTDVVWGAFAYTFYLGDPQFEALGHTSEEVAIASKTIGVFVTMAGIVVGGVALQVFGRMTCLVAGAFLAAVTNLLFWDLAVNAGFIDGFLGFTRLYDMFAALGADARLARLIAAIAAENIVVGIASVVFVAYLSGITNPRYAAVQYALLASLTMLIGTLGRGALGEMIETRGFGYVFLVTTALGMVAVIAASAEAARQSWQKKRGQRQAIQGAEA